MGGDDSVLDDRRKEYSGDAMEADDDNDGEEAKAGGALGGEMQDQMGSNSDIDADSIEDDKP